MKGKGDAEREGCPNSHTFISTPSKYHNDGFTSISRQTIFSRCSSGRDFIKEMSGGSEVLGGSYLGGCLWCGNWNWDWDWIGDGVGENEGGEGENEREGVYKFHLGF